MTRISSICEKNNNSKDRISQIKRIPLPCLIAKGGKIAALIYFFLNFAAIFQLILASIKLASA
jgi:hypothetical protein